MREFHSGKTVFPGGIALLLALMLNGNAQTGGQVFFQTTTFGMVGLARNQVARLNVLNPGNAYGNRTVACSADMGFLDDQGRELKSRTAPVDWDKAVSLEFDRSELASGALRVQIRAVVKTAINRPDPSVAPPVMPGSVCSLMPTLEIFDKDTGKTQLILSEGRSIILNTPANSPARTPAK
jgi:hypothetical protein